MPIDATECIFTFPGVDFVSIGDVRVMTRAFMRRHPELKDTEVSVAIKCPCERVHGVTFAPSMWEKQLSIGGRMAEKICPTLTRGSESLCCCVEGHPRFPPFPPEGKLCQLWENGDCGLKVARGDRYKEMWEELRKFVADTIGRHETNDALVESRVHGVCAVEGKMVAIEAEMMGKG